MKNISSRFEHLYKVISTKEFLNMQAIGGEIPFFIFAYDANQELLIKKSIKFLKNKLESSGIGVLEINLYELICEILEKKGGIDRMFMVEKNKSKNRFLKALQSSLNIHEVLMPKIKEKINGSVGFMFLTRTSLIFPLLRIMKNIKMIFIPGRLHIQMLHWEDFSTI